MSLQFSQGWLTHLCSIPCQLEWLKWGWKASFQDSALSWPAIWGWIWMGAQLGASFLFIWLLPKGCFVFLTAWWLSTWKTGSGSCHILKTKTQKPTQHCFCHILLVKQLQDQSVPRREVIDSISIKEDLWVSFIHYIIESIGQLREASHQEAELKIHFFEKIFEALLKQVFITYI